MTGDEPPCDVCPYTMPDSLYCNPALFGVDASDVPRVADMFPDYTPDAVDVLFDGRPRMTTLDVLALPIPGVHRLWAVLRRGAMDPCTQHDYGRVASNTNVAEKAVRACEDAWSMWCPAEWDDVWRHVMETVHDNLANYLEAELSHTHGYEYTRTCGKCEVYTRELRALEVDIGWDEDCAACGPAPWEWDGVYCEECDGKVHDNDKACELFREGP